MGLGLENGVDGRALAKFCLTCALEFPILYPYPLSYIACDNLYISLSLLTFA